MHENNNQVETLNGPAVATRSPERVSAGAGEVRHCKGPAESLGPVALGKLPSSFIMATVGTIALMALLTVVPYIYSKQQAAKADKAAKEPEKKDVADVTKPEPKQADGQKPADKTQPTTTVDNKKDVAKPSKDHLDKLNKTETKPGTPKDPFGTNVDDLLDPKDKK
jgi:hypothetical protein